MDEEQEAGVSVRAGKGWVLTQPLSILLLPANFAPGATPRGRPRHRWKNKFRSESDQKTPERSGNATPGCPEARKVDRGRV